jgi:hypothetical protein
LRLLLGSPSGDRQQVRAHPQERRLALHRPHQAQELLPGSGQGESFGQAGEEPERSFETHDRQDLEARLGDFRAQLFGTVEVGGREPVEPAARVDMAATSSSPGPASPRKAALE